MCITSKLAVMAGVACSLISLPAWARLALAAPAMRQPAGKSQDPPGKSAPPAKSNGKSDEANLAKLPADAAVPVRPANRELYVEAVELMQKLRLSAEKLASRAKRPEEIKGASNPIKNEIIEDYKMLHRISQIGDELWLLGELDGLSIQQYQTQVVQPPLDAARAELRTYLGSPEGMFKAAERRAKEQVAHLKQLDEMIKQKQWMLAVKKQTELIHAANEVALFVEPEVAGEVYAPILERAARIAPEYLLELKTKQIIPKLREEYATERPDLAGLSRRIKGVVAGLREQKEIRWNDKVVTGPECLLEVAGEWQQMDRKVAQSLSVLHAIGEPAKLELNTLSADYTVARTDALALVSELIQAESSTIAGADVDARYMGYLAAIPALMSSLRGSPAEFAGVQSALNQLAARSPELANKVQRYREATSEGLRWRRRLVQRYLQSLRSTYTQARPMNELLDQPPPVPSEDGKRTTPRVNQAYLIPRQFPQDVGAAWSKQWQGMPLVATKPLLMWPANAEPIGISPWHGRVYAEVVMSRQELTGAIQALWRDLAIGPNKAPLTLEAALALHTATYGPYIEVGGMVTSADVQSLPDRLWDWGQPLDVSGSLQPGSLAGPGGFPLLVRLVVAPSWLVHDYFVWVAPTRDAPRGSTPTASPASGTTPAGEPAAAPAAGTATPATKPAPVGPSSQPKTAEKAPSKPESAPPPPAGGKPF